MTNGRTPVVVFIDENVIVDTLEHVFLEGAQQADKPKGLFGNMPLLVESAQPRKHKGPQRGNRGWDRWAR